MNPPEHEPHISTVGESGQVTLPKHLLERLDVAPGDAVVVRFEDESLVVRALPDSSLYIPRLKKHLSWRRVREMAWDEAIAEDVAKGHYGSPLP